MSELRTEAGKRDHDVAWRTGGEGSVVSHDYAREGCAGCEFIAWIEAEAASPAPDRELDYWRERALQAEEQVRIRDAALSSTEAGRLRKAVRTFLDEYDAYRDPEGDESPDGWMDAIELLRAALESEAEHE